MSSACPREFEGESAEAKANWRKMLRSGLRPASRAHRVLNYVLSCVLANSKVSLLRLRQTGEKSFSPVCVPGLRAYPCPQLCPRLCPREFEGESAEAKANLRKMLLSGVPAYTAHRVLNYVLSCVLANSKVSLLRLRQTGENSSSPA